VTGLRASCAARNTGRGAGPGGAPGRGALRCCYSGQPQRLWPEWARAQGWHCPGEQPCHLRARASASWGTSCGQLLREPWRFCARLFVLLLNNQLELHQGKEPRRGMAHQKRLQSGRST